MKQHIVAPGETIPYQLSDLVAFLRVADHGSFSRAAAVLGETKGTVSRRITRLESQLGARLFQRTSRSVALSEAGALYRAAVQTALESLEQAAQRARRGQDEPEGTLRLTAPEDLATHLVPQLLHPFLRAHPRVRVELTSSNAVLDLAAHRLDVALRAADTLPDSAYVATRIMPVQAALFAAPSYLAERGVPRQLGSVADRHRLVLRDGDVRGDRLWLRTGPDAAPEKLTGGTVFQATSYSDVLAAAEAGLGIACVPTLITKRAVAEGRLRRILPRLSTVSAWLFLVHARGLLPARVRAFRDHVAAYVRFNPFPCVTDLCIG
ncbi:MAG TPA: LysR substrate-binding domain-containing protein, partial [Polyangia bacterium]